MLTLLVIGIGTGNPEHMTVQAINALNRADIVLVPRKGAAREDLAELRRAICHRFLTNEETRIVEFDLPRRQPEGAYHESVDAWHAAIAETYRTLLSTELPTGGSAALLVWGDPSLYDSTLRIIERLRAQAGPSFAVEVTPGITSVQALAASHAMPLNAVGGAVHLTTGRRLREDGWPEGADTVVIMLDGDMAFRTLPSDRYDIYWGAYLGFDNEITISGRLGAVADRIAETRAQARARHGWIMDIYVLRTVSDVGQG